MSGSRSQIKTAVIAAIMAAVATVATQYYFDIVTSKADAERITELSSSLAEYKEKFNASEQRVDNLENEKNDLTQKNDELSSRLRDAELELRAIPSDLVSARKDIEALEDEKNTLINANQELKNSLDNRNLEIERLETKQAEIATATRILEKNYDILEESFGELSKFDSYEEAIKTMGENAVEAKILNAQNALKNFVRSQQTFSEVIAPQFDGEIEELANTERDLEPRKMFFGILAILRQKDLRREKIEAASSQLMSRLQP